MAIPSSPTKKSVPLSFIGKGLRLIFNLLLIGFLAWMLLLFLATLGVLAWGWQNVWEIFQQAILNMTPHLWVSHLGLESNLQHVDIAIASPSWVAWIFPDNSMSIAKLIHGSIKVGITFLLITQFVVERCQVFAVGLSVIIAFALLGLVDGLVKRDLRKFNNARESTLFFHRSKHLLSTVFFTGYFLFIAVPLELNLTFCLILMAIITSCIAQVSVHQFKKHL